MGKTFGGADMNMEKWEQSNQGRFPANLITDGSEEVRECFPETKSTPRTATVGGTGGVGVNTNFQRGSETSNFNDSGNASRFFKSIPQGRFPANLILEDCDEVKKCFPETKSGNIKPHKRNTRTNIEFVDMGKDDNTNFI